MGKKLFKKVSICVLVALCSVCAVMGVTSTKKQSPTVNAQTWTQSDIKYFGYDISIHQGAVNFTTMKRYADFVICRIGYGTSLDSNFKTYMTNAKAAGLHVGCYIFSLATTVAQAENEATWVVNQLASLGFNDGYMTFPVFFDYEQQSVITSKTKAQNTAIVNAFIAKMNAAGYYADMYVGGSNFTAYFDHSTLKCAAWVAHYGYTDQVSYFNNKYKNYNTSMWQFDGDGYDTPSTKRGTTVGASSTNIDHDFCFVDYPAIIQAGGYNGFTKGKDNKVLGNCTDALADKTWVTTNNHNANSASFANREVSLTSSNGAENAIYFTQTNETHQVIEADFTVTGKTSAELYGKFGLAFIDKIGKGFLFYCNASGTTGTAVSNVTGTSVGIVGRTAGSNYSWGSEVEKASAWNPAQKVTLKIERIGGYYKCYANGVLAFEGVTSSYGIDTNQEVYPSIRSFNVYLKVKNYSQRATVNSITLDGDLSDWKTNENWGKISADKKSVADSSNANKKAEFYHRLTDEGLFIYAEAHHSKTTSGADDWWKNTNFEMFINSDAVSAQFYASEGVVEGFKAFCFKTTGSDGNYVTILEGFIDNATLKSKAGYKGSSLTIGYAFKVDNGTIVDEITPSGGTKTSYWCAGNSEPRTVPYTVTKEASYTSGYSYTVNNVGNWVFSGNKLTLSGCTSGKDDTIYFKDNVTTKHEFSATFKITGKESAELYGKIGIAYIDDYGDGFFFYADAAGTTGTGVANVTGTTFGLVYSSEGSYLWSNAKSKTLTGATFTAGQEFTLKVVRQDNSATLYANNVSLATINYSDYTILNNKNVYPSIMSFNIRAEVTNAGIKNVQQGGIKFDGDLSDWKALDNWDKIEAKKVGVYDSASTGKGVTFYTLLNGEGLFIAAEAKHAKTTFGYTDWWKNTNIECFIGQSDMEHQFYATKSIRKGWNKSEMVTTGTSGNYKTIFEGFISKEYLTNVLCMNASEIKIGYAFKVDNLGTVSDTITPTGGTATSYWCVGKDPLALNNVIKASDYVDQDRTVTVEKATNGSVTADKTTAKAGTKITLTIKANGGYSVGSIEVKTASGKSVTVSGNTFTMPDENVTVKVTFNKDATTSSSSSKVDSSKPSSSSSQESSKPSSSTVDSSKPTSSKADSSKADSSKPTSSVTTPDSSKPTSSVADSSSIAAPETPSSSNGGCKGSVSTTLTVLLPLALIAVIVFIKKSKEQR